MTHGNCPDCGVETFRCDCGGKRYRAREMTQEEMAEMVRKMTEEYERKREQSEK